MFGSIGMGEMLIILLVALLLFGRRLPEVARSLGKGITEFKRGMREIENDVKTEVPAAPAAGPSSPESAPKDGGKGG